MPSVCKYAHIGVKSAGAYTLRTPDHQTTALGILSEDCLTINVYRPSGLAANAKLPVVSIVMQECVFTGLDAQLLVAFLDVSWFPDRTVERPSQSSYSYGGGFDGGAASIFNASALVAQSVARVFRFLLNLFLEI